MTRPTNLLIFLLILFAIPQANSATISGELKKWHKVTLLFDGPSTSEGAATNPFTDYRLIVTFINGTDTSVVHGHYAADGDAAETSADTGSVWRVYFAPSKTGTWNYSASFRTGTNVAWDDNPTAGSGTSFDGETDTFSIAPTDKTGRDFRAQGLLQYVGEHYLQFAETGKYFLKGGADSPENFLGYYEFDQTSDQGGAPTPDLNNNLHEYAPHVTHWNSGDPTWQGTKGKGIIGALNYLHSKGMNSVYFLTYNIDGGDGQDTWMWTAPGERYRFDVSKMDQWEIVFAHADSLGILLNFVTQEVENNDALLDKNVNNSNMRKLYYRELVSRFAHHLAIVWNMGEENSTGEIVQSANAKYFRDTDPYDHPITVHTLNNQGLGYYQGILDNPAYIEYFEATSLQGDRDSANTWAINIRNYSESKGKKWVVMLDESDFRIASDLSNLDIHRKESLWGNLMGGGGGMEWYFAYQNAIFHDLQTEDWSHPNIAPIWDQTRYALDFFQTYLPFHEMEPDNGLFTSLDDGYCFAKEGEMYAVYLKQGGNGQNVSLNITGTDDYTIKWYNPRTGGALQDGSETSVTANNGTVNIGRNPVPDANDWVVIVTIDTPTVTPITQTTWTGANLDQNWFEPGNWTNGVPTDSVDAVIPDVSPNGFPVISGAPGTTADAKDLTISSGATVTISGLNNVSLIVHGDLDNNGAVLGLGKLEFNGTTHELLNPVTFKGTVYVKAGATLNTNGNLTLSDSSSLLHGAGTEGGGGSVIGNVILKKQGYSGASYWNYWGSPVTGAGAAIVGNPVYRYNPLAATDSSTLSGLQNGWTAASGNMNPGVGYIGQNSGAVTFSGSVAFWNSGTDLNVTLNKSNTTGVGYNLLGNPFPSSMSADSFMAVNGPVALGGNGIITGALYFWDDDGSNGSGYSKSDFAVWSSAGSVSGPNSGKTPNGHIAVGQGFFAEKIDAGASNVSFSNEMRTSNNNVFFRTSNTASRIWLKASNSVGIENELLVAFIADATAGRDLQYDARKMRGNEDLAFYSKIDDQDFAIQALPQLNEDVTVELGVDVGIAGLHTISIEALENLDETVVVLLEDRQENIIHNLSMQPVYSFQASAGNTTGRFYLHFNAPMEITSSDPGCENNDGEIYLNQPGDKIWKCSLYDEDGVLVYFGKDVSGAIFVSQLPPSNYSLQLEDSLGTFISKVINIEAKRSAVADFDLSAYTFGVGEELSITSNATGAAQIEWNLGDGTIQTGVSEIAHTYGNPGTYEVKQRVSNADCADELSQLVEVTQLVGVEQANGNEIKVLMVGNELIIHRTDENSSQLDLRLFNLLGEKMLYREIFGSTYQLNLGTLATGCYIVQLQGNNMFNAKRIYVIK